MIKTEKKIIVIEGLVERNPYGPWSDVDHGIYVDGERVANADTYDYTIFDSFIGKKIKITIEEVE